jgi:acetaldehyde dehydrogenase (acetylating)
MTLGCGAFGGNITSDNISPLHLLNIKRLAYEVSPLVADAPGQTADAPAARADRSLPTMPGAPAAGSGGVPAEVLRARVEAFLSSRGLGTPSPSSAQAPASPPTATAPPPTALAAQPPAAADSPQQPPPSPVAFVCEEDVRLALRGGRTILVGERTIITPAARELGTDHKVFIYG